MTPEEFNRGLQVLMQDYPETRVLPGRDGERPLRVAPVPIPASPWGGGTTRLLVVFNLGAHDSTRPRGLLGPEWKLPGGAAPMNANPVYEFGEAWQAFSWVFPWPPALSVVETVEAYLGRFNDPR